MELTNGFMAYTEDGKPEHLSVMTRFATGRSSQGSYKTAAGKDIFTDSGLSVNRLAKGKYQIADSGVLLFSDSPDAE